MRILFRLACLLAATAGAGPAAAQGDPAEIYTATCAVCHDNAQVRAPDRAALRAMSPAAILTALTTGSMAINAEGLSLPQKQALAAYLGAGTTGGPISGAAMCASQPLGDPARGPRWNGWGIDSDNSRFQKDPGLTAADVPRLEVKWAFGFPGATSAFAQPTVVAGRVFVGSDKAVYALDAKTGCMHWSFAAPGVRTAIVIGAVTAAGVTRQVAFFGDLAASVHAVDAQTGIELWARKLDSHRAARITGAPVLNGSRLYVPVSSIEEGSGGRDQYACCTFRGSVAALDTATGNVIWQTYTIAEEPKPVRTTPAGTQLWGPAGAAVWNSPTLDLKRGLLYIGTGNAYTEPAAATSDAILALDLATGARRWAKQFTGKDVFVLGCRQGSANCPQQMGPDFDFGASPILRSIPGGKQILVVGQKSGVVYGLDPDKEGAVVWQFRAGKGGALGGIEWGMAADEQNVYVPISDVLDATSARGLYALRIDTGEQVWHTPAPPPVCKEDRGCAPAQSAAITVIPGVVFAGAIDGYMRAYSTKDGSILWQFNTAREFETVNGVKAAGGSIDSAGPVIVDGMLYTPSGYGAFRGKPGNILLAFGR